MKHKHKYKIIGTFVVPEFIAVDVVCFKCGKPNIYYVYDDYEKQIYKQAIRGKYLKVPKECVLTKKQYKDYLSIY